MNFICKHNKYARHKSINNYKDNKLILININYIQFLNIIKFYYIYIIYPL